MNRFVHTIGQQHLLRRQSKMLRNNSFYWLPLRILRQVLRSRQAQSLHHSRRRPKGVFVKVQSQCRTSCQRRMILRHRQYRLARLHCPQICSNISHNHFILTRTLAACPVKPSASASAIACGPICFRPCRVYCCTVIVFTKSITLNPPRTRPTRPVGSTWFGPE